MSHQCYTPRMSTQLTTTPTALDLGWFVLCLPTGDSMEAFEENTSYLTRAGFRTVGGEPESGWAVMANGACEITPMRGIPGIMLNWRGPDIPALVDALRARG